MYLERFKLDGRVAVVTGGAQAIGFACVEALAEGGAHVYIADRNPAAGKEAQAALDAKGVQVDFIEMDVTDPRPSTPPRRTNASKAGVHHLTKSLAAEWGGAGNPRERRCANLYQHADDLVCETEQGDVRHMDEQHTDGTNGRSR
jgi:NAD(P)-dependent dehydrogenase (short-subunit alcohol dehydrogenase family)